MNTIVLRIVGMRTLISTYQKIGLIPAIIIALVLGTIVGTFAPELGLSLGVLGNVFIGALKAVAPLLVFVLVVAAIANFRAGFESNIRSIIVMYLAGTFLAALTAVAVSFVFPTTLVLIGAEGTESYAPAKSLADVLNALLMNLVANPIASIANANYLGILLWAVLLGLGLRHSSDATKQVITDVSNAVSLIVKWVIALAPFGILGIVASTIAITGFEALEDYARLLFVLVGSMAFIALILNPLIVFVKTRKNPYPLTFTCLRESGVTAFFTRSSAANIPVNMALAHKLGLNKNTYSVAIPLGATINMAGAAITINVLTLAAAHTMGVEIGFFQALLLAVVSSISACGASGVPGGSLLLIPLACSLFNISDDIAMQVVAVGFIIGVVQDSAETALNSSTDVLFVAAADPQYTTN